MNKAQGLTLFWLFSGADAGQSGCEEPEAGVRRPLRLRQDGNSVQYRGAPGQRGHHQTERQQSIQGEAFHIHSRECCNKSGRYLHIITCEGLNSERVYDGSVCPWMSAQNSA